VERARTPGLPCFRTIDSMNPGKDAELAEGLVPRWDISRLARPGSRSAPRYPIQMRMPSVCRGGKQVYPWDSELTARRQGQATVRPTRNCESQSDAEAECDEKKLPCGREKNSRKQNRRRIHEHTLATIPHGRAKRVLRIRLPLSVPARPHKPDQRSH